MDVRRNLTFAGVGAAAVIAVRLLACSSSEGGAPPAAAAGASGKAGGAGKAGSSGLAGQGGLAWAKGEAGWEPIPLDEPEPGCPVDRAVGDMLAPGFTWTGCGEGCERDDAHLGGEFRNLLVESHAPFLTHHLGVVRLERGGAFGQWILVWMVDPTTNQVMGAIRSTGNKGCIHGIPDTFGIIRFDHPDIADEFNQAAVLQAKGGLTRPFKTTTWGQEWTDGESVFLFGNVVRYGLDGSKPVVTGAVITGLTPTWDDDLVMTSGWAATFLSALVDNTPPTVKVDMSGQLETTETVGYVGFSDDKIVVPLTGWEGEFQKSKPTHRRFWIADRKPLGANPTVSPKFPALRGTTLASRSAGDFTAVSDDALDGPYTKLFVLRRTDMKYFQVPLIPSARVFGMTPTHLYVREDATVDATIITGISRFELAKIDAWGLPVPPQ